MTDKKSKLVMPKTAKKVKFKYFSLINDSAIIGLDEEGRLWAGEPELDEEGDFLHMIWAKLNMPTGEE